MQYDLEVTDGGAFHIYLLAKGPDSSSNSFSISVDSGANSTVNTSTTGWSWVQNSTSSTFNLANGSHKLFVRNLEDGAQVDKILITKSSTPPTGLGGFPDLPNFDE
jgi:hypothetical protein